VIRINSVDGRWSSRDVEHVHPWRYVCVGRVGALAGWVGVEVAKPAGVLGAIPVGVCMGVNMGAIPPVGARVGTRGGVACGMCGDPVG